MLILFQKDSDGPSGKDAMEEELVIQSHSVQSAAIAINIDSPGVINHPEVVSDEQGSVPSENSPTTQELLTPDTLRDLNAASRRKPRSSLLEMVLERNVEDNKLIAGEYYYLFIFEIYK